MAASEDAAAVRAANGRDTRDHGASDARDASDRDTRDPGASASYLPLWCKSYYSFLEGASSPDELVAAAAGYGLPGIALSERDGLYGAVRAHVAAREHGVQLLHGAQLSLSGGRVVLMYALDRAGYGSLSRLITRGRSRRPKGESLLEPEDILEFQPSVTGAGAVMLVVPVLNDTATGLVELLFPAFGRAQLFLGAVRHEIPEDRRRHFLLADLSKRYQLRIVATPEVLYHHPDRQRLQDVLTSIRHGVKLSEAGTRLRPNNRYSLPHPAHMRRRYRDIPEALSNGLELLERAEFGLEMLEYRYPEEPIPEGYSREGRLRELCRHGAHERYGEVIPEAVRLQLEKELSLIRELRYEGYFLTMYEIVAFCRSQEILCQGRGSAANSVVCYSLGITAVDPVRMQLLFERFLSRERAEPPDIDLDIEHQRREEVITYVYKRYGRRHAAMVANTIRYRPKSALRDVGKVLDIPPLHIERAARLLGHRSESIEPALRDAGLAYDKPPYLLLRELAEQLCDVPRHLSIHPGGFLLGAEEVASIVPVENGRMPGRTVIQWDKYDIEEMNLFKVDLLGLGALTHLRMGFELLHRHLGVDVSMASIPVDDPAVYEMLHRADTVGVFQLESRAQMAMLPRLLPRRFYDLVIEISIVRPGPIAGGMVHPYLKRRAGEEELSYPHSALIPVLERTLGVPIFQEQVMRVAMIAADYTPGEADQLRRDMAAWRRHGVIERHHDRIVGRMSAKGIEPRFAEQVFDQIRGFGEYGFPESHAAGFALIAYATAWLRARHPVVFTCALLNAWPMGFYSPATIVEDARRHGVDMLPLCIVHSDWDCLLAPQPDGSFAVRMGFRYLKGFGQREYERLEDFRRRQNVGTLTPAELQSEIGLSAAAVELFAEAGALDLLESNRRRAVWRGGARHHEQEAHTTEAASHQHSSQDSLHTLLRGFEQPSPEFDVPGPEEQILWDYESTGHSTAGHPMQRFRELLSSLGMKAAEDVLCSSNGKRVLYAGMVICRQRPSTAGGIVFITLEDESGFINLILRSSVFDAFRALVVGSSVLGVEGRIQRSDGVVHILVERCFDPFRIQKAEGGPGAAAQDARLPQDYIGRDGKPVRVQSRDFQ
ncbi:MAG: DNA polymerase III subunit alpha [Spirochaetaceae bacterium]|nr:MAG: DNA polymerase III subunit alpha [Spirochaetaceae bacterium]